MYELLGMLAFVMLSVGQVAAAIVAHEWQARARSEAAEKITEVSGRETTTRFLPATI